MNSSASLLAIPALAACCAGCGGGHPPTYPVAGRVRFVDGQPVPFGLVEFRSAGSAVTARGKIDSRGEFALSTFAPGDGALAGNHQVVVVQHFTPLPKSPRSARSGGQLPTVAGHDHSPNVVATRHSKYETSGLTAVVKAQSKNVVQLVVERAGLQPAGPSR